MSAEPTPTHCYSAAESGIVHQERRQFRSDLRHREVRALERFLTSRAKNVDFDPPEAHERTTPSDDTERLPLKRYKTDAGFVGPLVRRVASEEDDIREGLAQGLYIFEVTDAWWRFWQFALRSIGLVAKNPRTDKTFEKITVINEHVIKGRTQEQVAELLNCDRVSVSRWKWEALDAMVQVMHAIRAGKLKPSTMRVVR